MQMSSNQLSFAGDIEIIGALGDGLVAGLGALSSDVRDLHTQHRGVSFATGKLFLIKNKGS
jgi:hypothetical protein